MPGSLGAGVRCWVIDPNPEQEPLGAVRAAAVTSLLGIDELEASGDPDRPRVGIEGDDNSGRINVPEPAPKSNMFDSRIASQEPGQPGWSRAVPAAGTRDFASDDQPARAEHRPADQHGWVHGALGPSTCVVGPFPATTYKGRVTTGFEKTKGRAYETKMPQLGEMVFALIPVDKGSGGSYKAPKLATRWLKACD